MTSTTVGLPDRYRPLEQLGPEEPTPTGVITSWRAKDRVLNRDVALRVHTPGGSAAHSWITRALTAGGLATPALAMVYDASEGTAEGAGGAAYVVNEWIDGESLRERLTRGPLPDREARTILRRLAEGVAEAHRVGLAVGGLTPDNVVLRPNGLVGLRGVPASTGTVAGDITALGTLLEFALTGRSGDDAAGPALTHAPLAPDLAALVRRARSSEPGQGLSSAAAMASLLAERPRATGIPRPSEAMRSADSGRLSRLRRDDDVPAPAGRTDPPAAPRPGGAHAAPPIVPPAPTRPGLPLEPPAAAPVEDQGALPLLHGDRYDALEGEGYDADYRDPGPYTVGLAGPDLDDDALHEPAGLENPTARRRLVVWGVPVLALAIVIGLAVWLGTSVLSVADSVGQVKGSTPTVPSFTSGAASGSSASGRSSTAARPSPGAAVPISAASVFDPFGDGEPENDDDVPKSYDGDPETSWSTLEYRGSAAFGNLKPGVGVLYDLGSKRSLAGVTLTTTTPGATVEVRTGDSADGSLDSYAVAKQVELTGTDTVRFDRTIKARYVLIWVTRLVPADGQYQADLAEVSIQHAG